MGTQDVSFNPASLSSARQAYLDYCKSGVGLKIPGDLGESWAVSIAQDYQIRTASLNSLGAKLYPRVLQGAPTSDTWHMTVPGWAQGYYTVLTDNSPYSFTIVPQLCEE